MTTEAEARKLRAAIYGDVSDASWEKLAPVWTGMGRDERGNPQDNLHWLRQNQPVHCAPCPPGMHWKTWCGHADAPA